MRTGYFLGACVAAIAAFAAPDGAAARDRGGDSSIVCESANYRYRHCAMDTRGGVRLVTQISSRSGRCAEGVSWGWDKGGVWVDGGCRARFESAGGRRHRRQDGGWRGNPWSGAPWSGAPWESRPAKRHRGKDWPYLPERGWYDGSSGPWGFDRQRGFRPPGRPGDYRPGIYRPGIYRSGRTLDCASQNYGRSYCPADTRRGVQLLQQLSTRDGPCTAGASWGWDAGGIWVDNGCRGRFLLRRN